MQPAGSVFAPASNQTFGKTFNGKGLLQQLHWVKGLFVNGFGKQFNVQIHVQFDVDRRFHRESQRTILFGAFRELAHGTVFLQGFEIAIGFRQRKRQPNVQSGRDDHRHGTDVVQRLVGQVGVVRVVGVVRNGGKQWW